MPAGRPTKYKPEYCDEVIRFCAGGLSLTAFCGEIEINRDTLSEWRKVYPEFDEACKISKAKRTLALERDLLDKESSGAVVNARRFALINADPDEWREKVVNEHTGAAGGPIQITYPAGSENL